MVIWRTTSSAISRRMATRRMTTMLAAITAFTAAGPRFTRPSFLAFASTVDRKSTRLNSSHEWISYAVFCLKKKKKKTKNKKKKNQKIITNKEKKTKCLKKNRPQTHIQTVRTKTTIRKHISTYNMPHICDVA